MGRTRAGERGQPGSGPSGPAVPASPPRRRARALALLGALLAAVLAAVAARVYTHFVQAQAAAQQVRDAGMGRGKQGTMGRTRGGERTGQSTAGLAGLEGPRRGTPWLVTLNRGAEWGWDYRAWSWAGSAGRGSRRGPWRAWLKQGPGMRMDADWEGDLDNGPSKKAQRGAGASSDPEGDGGSGATQK